MSSIVPFLPEQLEIFPLEQPCADCGGLFPRKAFCRKGRVTGRCPACRAARKLANQNASNKKNDQILRRTVLSAYGGVCAYCGETDVAALQIDHMNGDGKKWRAEHNRAGHMFWRWLRDNGYPSDYQVLCKTCNFAKSDKTDEEFRAWMMRVCVHLFKDV